MLNELRYRHIKYPPISNSINIMRLSLPTILFCAIMLCTTAWSQPTDVRHPENPDAEMIGTMRLNVTPRSEVQRGRSVLEVEGTIWNTVAIFRSEGRIDYYVNVDSIAFTGDCAWLDGTGTVLLFDLLCRTVILQGMAEGHTPCPHNCNDAYSSLSRVYVAACVQREGTGAGTKFSRCTANDYSMREYLTCCPVGIEVPQVQVIRSTGGGCSSGSLPPLCESTGS